MQRSTAIHDELQRCRDGVAAIERAKSVRDVESQWRYFLIHLERVWNKCQHHYKKSPKWNGWKGRYEAARRRDDLLVYLVNARGADEHTANDITKAHPKSLSIGAGPSGYAHIKRLVVTPKGIEYEGDGDLSITFHPEHIEPLPVVNRGREYPVPTRHLGEPLSDTTVLGLAREGLAYYERLVDEADRAFVKSENA